MNVSVQYGPVVPPPIAKVVISLDTYEARQLLNALEWFYSTHPVAMVEDIVHELNKYVGVRE